MPWRARQIYGHLGRTVLPLASVPRFAAHKSHPVAQPFHQSIVARCPAATASLVVPTSFTGHLWGRERRGESTAGRSGGQDPRVRQSIHRVPKVKHRQVGCRDDHPLGPAVDETFAQWSKEGVHLESLRGEGRWTELWEYLSNRTRAAELAELMVDTLKPHRALHVLMLSYTLGCKLKQSAYECVAHQLATMGQWSLVTSVVHLGRRQSGRTTTRLLNWRARALVEAQEFAALDLVLDVFGQEQLQPNRRTFHILMSGHLQNRDLVRAKRCLTAMEEAGFNVDASTHALILSSYRALGHDPVVQAKASEVLDEGNEEFATVIINGLVRQALDSEDLSGALHYLAMFKQHGNDNASTPAAAVPLRVADTKPLKPSLSAPLQDAHTFTILINHLTKHPDLPRVLQLLDNMRVSGVQPDSSTAAAVIRAHFAAGEVSTAVRIVADMCVEQQVPATLFQNLGLPSGGDIGPALLPAGIPPTVEVFNSLLTGILASRGLKGMRIVERIMDLCDIKPDETTVFIMLLHLDKVEHALPRDMMLLMRRLMSHPITPTIKHMNVLLHSILRREHSLRRRLDRLLASESAEHSDKIASAEARLSGVADSFDPFAGLELPDWLSYRNLIRPLFYSLISRQVRSDKATYGMRIRHDAVVKGDLAMAKQSFQAMINRGFHPNVYHFSAVMEGYARLGDVDSALAVWESARKAGIKPDVKSLTILIHACTRQKNAGRALRIYREMIAADMQPDVTAVHALVQAFIASGGETAARRLLLELWPMVAEFPEDMRLAPLPTLMTRFASFSGKEHKGVKRLSAQQKRMMRWRVNKLVKGWTSLHPHRDSLDWSKFAPPRVAIVSESPPASS